MDSSGFQQSAPEKLVDTEIMKNDPLHQYSKLREKLLAEKNQLETRLAQLNRVLGEDAPAVTAASRATRSAGRSRGRGRNALSMREAVIKALSNGPLARKELVDAVEAVGYVFTTENPLNSLGAVLYGKDTPVKSKDGKFYVSGSAAVSSAEISKKTPPAATSKRTMSPEGKARIIAAQKARWAKQRKANALTK